VLVVGDAVKEAERRLLRRATQEGLFAGATLLVAGFIARGHIL
jgi:hypothetical protein